MSSARSRTRTNGSAWQRWIPLPAWVGSALLVVLLVDLLFIGADVVVGENLSRELHVYTEGGVPEWFQWLKFLVAVVLLAVLARRTALYWVWAALFGYLFLDDAFMGHERVTARLIVWFDLERNLALPFPVYTLVEVLYMAAVALTFLVLIRWAVKRNSSPTARRYTLEAIVLAAVLVGFAGAGDFIGRVVFGGSHLAEVTEDAGEMIVATLMLAHVVRQFGIERSQTRRESDGRLVEDSM